MSKEFEKITTIKEDVIEILTPLAIPGIFLLLGYLISRIKKVLYE